MDVAGQQRDVGKFPGWGFGACRNMFTRRNMVASLDPICNFITRASLRSLLIAIVFARCVAFWFSVQIGSCLQQRMYFR